MQVNWFFGPEKEPFGLDDAGAARASARDPFHGIVSRGTLKLLDHEGVSPDVWFRNAHCVFLRNPKETAETEELALLRACAAKCGALSFGESATCVRIYLENHCPVLHQADELEAWNIKEGHTSSVWKVSCLQPGGGKLEFVVNIARDRDASIELEVTSERMRRIGLGCPNINMAMVHDIQTVRSSRGQEPIHVVVTRNDWISGSSEIHAVYDDEGRRQHYLLIERFLTAAETPAQITSIYGRRFTEQECRRIEDDIARFLELASTILSRPPDLNLNHGDLVWDGHRAVVIATSTEGRNDAEV